MTDIAIIGGGIAGLSLALNLHRHTSRARLRARTRGEGDGRRHHAAAACYKRIAGFSLADVD